MRRKSPSLVPGPRDPMRNTTLSLVCVAFRRRRRGREGRTGEASFTSLPRTLHYGNAGYLILSYLILSKDYIYKTVWQVVDAVNAAISVEFPIDDVDKLRVLEAEFRAASRKGVWRGQVGCVDGVHFAMQAPTKDDVKDPLK